MDPERRSVVRKANIVWALCMAVPVAYIVTVLAYIQVGGGALASENQGPGIWVPLIVLASIGDVAIFFYFQFSKRIATIYEKRKSPPNARYHILSVSCRTAEALSVYGFVLSFLSGTLVYVVGLSLATWTMLVWARVRFVMGLRKL